MKPTEFIHHATPTPGTHYACESGFRFAMKYNTMAEAWDACQRPDWMLWILDRLNLPYERERRLFAIWCARSVEHLLTDQRSRDAIDVVEKFANGLATDEELSSAYTVASAAASYAAYSAYAASAASAAYAAYSAYAASAASAAYAAASAAAFAAASVYASAAYSSSASAYSSAYSYSVAQSAQANHLRALIPNPFKEAP